MKSTLRVVLILLVTMAVFGGVAQAQTPVTSDMVRFQGTLPGFGKGGNKAGLYCVDFKLYDTPLLNAGTLVYAWPTCTTPYVNADAAGNFTVYLRWPADDNQPSKQRLLAVLFGSPIPTEIQRILVTSTPYANNANRVGGLTVAQIQAGAAGMQPVYTNTGAAISSSHMVTGTVTLSSGDPGAASVTLSGAAAFSSSTTYLCSTTNMTRSAAVYVTRTSGTSITFTGSGNGSDLVAYMCVGN